jgi:hypothetical protein
MRPDAMHMKQPAYKRGFRVNSAWFCLPLMIAILTLALRPATVPAQSGISKEYQIKAVFLFNFAQFVQWPETNFTDTNAPFRIGVLGDDPFDGFLDETVRGENVNGHPLMVQRYRHPGDVKDCQILFVSRSESSQMEQILIDLKGKSILTVGDAEGFVKDGGVIRFVTEQNKIHLRISPEAAQNANLTISSKILRLSEIVEPGKD